MKKRIMVLGAVMVCALCIWAPAGLVQIVPALINYQGQLTDPAGVPINGDTVSMSFRLLDADTVTATVLWGETHNAVLVTDGLYNVILGSLNPIPAPAFAGTTVYLEVRVDGEIFRPRARLTSVAYAVQAQNSYACVEADKLDGQDATDFSNLIHQHAGADITSGAVGTNYFSAASDLAAEGLLDNNADADLLTRLQADGRYVNTTGDDAMAGNLRVDGRLNVGSGGTMNLADGLGDVYVKNDLEVDGFLYAKGHIFLYAMEGEGLSGTAYIQARDLSGTSSINLRLRTQNAGVLVEAAIIKNSGLVHVGPSGAEDFVDGAGDLYVQDELEVDGVANFSGGINAPSAIDAADVSFNYANSGSKGGAASDLACADCVAAAEVQFNYAGSATEGGAATNALAVDVAYLRNLDLDGDGHYKPISSNTPNDDCEDGNPEIFLGHVETCGDGVDNNCRNGDCYFTGNLDTDNAHDVFILGRYAYVADGDFGGMKIIDISNPANPVQVGAYDDGLGFAYGVFVVGRYAYLADEANGLRIVDVLNPAAPVMAGSLVLSASAMDVFVSGSYAYVADGGSGLKIVNVSNPAAPTLTGSYDTTDYANGVYVSGSYAYVADTSSGLQIINVSVPATPTLTGTYNTPGDAVGVSVSGSYAYVADNQSGLQIVDVSIPSTPTLAGTYNTPGNAIEVKFFSGHAIVADLGSGIQILNVSTPGAPTLAMSYNTPDAAWGVFISGEYVYVADGVSGLQVIRSMTPP